MHKIQHLLDEILQFKLPVPEVKEIPMDSLMPMELKEFPPFADTEPMQYAEQMVKDVQTSGRSEPHH